MIILILFFFYLLFENYLSLYNILFNFQFVITNIIILILIYLFDIYFLKNIEFGNKKLLIRFMGVIFPLLALIINYNYHFVQDELIFFLWYLIGYCFVSCIFQIILIKEEEKNKQESKIIEEENKQESKIIEEENKQENVNIGEEIKQEKS